MRRSGIATGANETLSGPQLWPFDPTLVKNGATVMHASDMTARRAEWDAGERRFLIGASKSATDILQALPTDEEWLKGLKKNGQWHVEVY